MRYSRTLYPKLNSIAVRRHSVAGGELRRNAVPSVMSFLNRILQLEVDARSEVRALRNEANGPLPLRGWRPPVPGMYP